MLVSYCVCIVLMAMYWFLCIIMNRKAVSVVPETVVDGVAVEDFSDLTDFKQENFKYTT